jgi:hypothetical protein
MRFISTILIIAAVIVAGVHVFFYWATGTVEPCQAAVERIIQKQVAQGNNVVATLGQTFKPQAIEVLRGEGIMACYRSALTGDAPEQLTLKFKLPRH